jgi:hypothetical protein
MIDSDTPITKSQRRLTVSGKVPVHRPASLTSSRIEDFTEQVRLPGASYRIVLNCKGTGSGSTKTKKSQGTT